MLPKICKTCVYLRVDTLRPTQYVFARCLKFSEQCNVSGEVKYHYAERCRRDYTLCGNSGKEHREKPKE